ncbi:MAG: hypothetical protein PHS66_02350 [Candidatus Omnitrophica bacterium]|nr:hypothetical protein [Candidatus Omnitrophota bacterium]
MKKCIYCSREIPQESLECKHCGETLGNAAKITKIDNLCAKAGEKADKEIIEELELMRRFLVSSQ